MASGSPWARWYVAAAMTCALVCGAANTAAAERRGAEVLSAPALETGPVEISQLAAVHRAPPKIFTGDGFDACTAPSLKAMSTWWSKSPYRAVGIYLGGINRACGDDNLSNSWVHSVTAMGWRIVPIYVGRQAPCTGQKHLTLMSPRIIANQADTAADDAAKRAAALGIAAGSPIYFDLESYSRKNAACTNTVLTHLSAWTNSLHAHGYLSGVYSSAGSGITDLAHSALRGIVRPDAVWIARWDKVRSVQDPAVPGNLWPHMRIKQLTGGHKETHGGVTINIDRDWLDGPVAKIS